MVQRSSPTGSPAAACSARRAPSFELLRRVRQVLESDQACASSRQLAQRITAVTKEVISAADSCSLFLLEPDGNWLRPCASEGIINWEHFRRIEVRLGTALSGKAAVRGEPLLFTGLRSVREALSDTTSSNLENYRRSVPDPGIELRAAACLPLRCRGRDLGVLVLHNFRSARFSPGDVRLAEQVAACAGETLGGFLLERELAAWRRCGEFVFQLAKTPGLDLDGLVGQLGRFLNAAVRVQDAEGRVLASYSPRAAGGRAPGLRMLRLPLPQPGRTGSPGQGAWLVVEDRGSRGRREHAVIATTALVAGKILADDRTEALQAAVLRWSLAGPASGELASREMWEALGLSNGESLTVAALACQEPAGLTPAELARRLREAMRAVFAQAFAVADESAGIALGIARLARGPAPGPGPVPAPAANIQAAWRAVYQALPGELAGARARLGLGGTAGGGPELVKAVAQARQCLAIALAGGRELVAPADLGLVNTLGSALPPSQREALVRQVLGPILPGQAGSSYLLETLETWFAHDRRAAETAMALHIHPNTLNYRLRRIETLLQRDLSRADDSCELMCALQLHRLSQPAASR